MSIESIARLDRVVAAAVLLPLLAACAGGGGAFDIAPEVAEEHFRERVQTLSADAMEGRAPASLGEARAVAYMIEQFRDIGLSETPRGGYTQDVPLVAVTASSLTPLGIEGPNGELELDYANDMMVWTKQLTHASELNDSQLVFVGYGIVAPEYGWNDYAGVDVRGKTVVALVNDPGFAARDPALFNGNAMTYYGRWTYKYEEAARQGAAGVFIVHETGAAGYPWEVVSGGWSGEQFDLVAADKNMGRAAVEGWLTRDSAEAIFELAGAAYAEAREQAQQRGFQAYALGVSASVSFQNSVRYSDSQNVIGVIPGSERPDEYIVYTGHWDHLGVAGEGEDRIFNGARDNAAGIAMLMGIAEGFLAAPEPPERSVVFLAVTAEESGLLGSGWYGANPVFPLETTVANINIDAPGLLGPTNDVTVIGFGSSELEDWLARAAQRQGRVLAAEPTPEKGFFYRSDHFNFARRGVPALYAKAGVDHREKGREYGIAWEAEWVAERYHKVGDEYDPDWDLRGLLEDMQLFYAVGAGLADSEAWPNWRPGNEFRRVRDASADARAGAD